LSVDNTFLSPALQSPLALGADIVMHSTTKFLNGHSDGLGGALIGSKPEHKERFHLVQKAAGGILSPFESFLVLRGIRTLPLRMKQHEENGRAVAEFLSTQPKLTRLAYPGLKSHPQHELAVRQQKGFGSMLSFDLGSREALRRIAGRGRVPGLPLGHHHARRLERRRARVAGHHAGAGAVVGGH
jgi:cystathionine beta-lyase/cystathionine gamma-synthase